MDHPSLRSVLTTPRRLNPHALAGVVLALCVGLTWQLWRSAERATAVETQARFSARVERAVERLNGRMLASVHMLRGVQALFASSTDVTRGEFADFVFSHDLDNELPGVQGVAYIQAVTQPELAAHLSQLRSGGFADYAVKPPGVRQFYAPVVYIEPFSGQNLRAFGFDCYSDPVRRVMLDQARDSGQPAMSGKVTLMQDDAAAARAGFVIALPVYRNGAQRLNLAQRRAALRGWVVAPFRIAEVLDGIDSDGTLAVRLIDNAALASPIAISTSADGQLHALRAVSVGGHHWALAADAIGRPEGRADALRPMAILITGLAATLVLSVLTWLLARSSVTTGQALHRARRLAAELDDGRRDAVALADTAYRAQAMMRSILDSTIDGILVDNGARVVLASNQRFRAMWGIPAGLDVAGSAARTGTGAGTLADIAAAASDERALLEHMVSQLLHPAPFLHRHSTGEVARGQGGAHSGAQSDMQSNIQSGAQPAEQYGEQREVLRLKDGRYFEQAVSPVRLGAEHARVWSFRDVTERKQIEQRDRGHRRVLELLARGAPLGAILDAVVLGVEESNPGMLCSIMLLDAASLHLLTVSAPSLPPFFNDALNGAPIGPTAGSCGAAAYHGVRVIIEDIASHPHWADYRELAARAGLGACWSEPIRGGPGRVLGSFAIYHRTPHYPSAAHVVLIEQAAQLAGIALERAEAASAVRIGEERFRSLYQNAPVALWELDWSVLLAECRRLAADGVDNLSAYLREQPAEAARLAALVRIADANSAALAQVGASAAAGPGVLALGQIFGSGDSCFADAVAALAGGALMFSCESRFVRVDGEGRQNEVTLLVMPGYADTLAFVIVSTIDITERKRLDAELLMLATTDFLTGLPNRREFMTRLDDELSRLQRSLNDCASVLMIDIDHFKLVNDRHGHACGDAVLRHMAGLMREAQRKVDVLGRVGGEEFAVLLPGATLEAAQSYAERLRQLVAERPVIWEGHRIGITVSIGLARLHANDPAGDSALIRADHALYKAKEEGRNRVRRAPEDWADASV